MATVKMVGKVNTGHIGGFKTVNADINASPECIEQALKDGFQFADKKDAEEYMKNKVLFVGK